MLLASRAVQDVAESLMISNGVLAGFKSATNAGPMCAEPMHGVALVVEEIVFTEEEEVDDGDNSSTSGHHGPLSGQIISTALRACRGAFLAKGTCVALTLCLLCLCVSSFVFSNLSHSFWNLEFDKIGTAPRLVEPHYRCKLQCAGEHLGALYGVLARRRGDVVEEDLWEGTLIFTIEALVSVKQAKFFCGSPAHTYFADLFVLSLSCALFL